MSSSPRIPEAELTGLYGAMIKRMSRKMFGEVPEPVVYGVQGALREYYGAKEGPPIASTLDHIVAAVAG